MEYQVEVTEHFKKDVRNYEKKKYKDIRKDLDKVISKLQQGNLVGDVIPNIKMSNSSNKLMKARVANSNILCGSVGRIQIDILCSK